MAVKGSQAGSTTVKRSQGGGTSESVYRVTEIIGSSSESWEAAARSAIETASATLRDLRIAEVVKFDLQVENGKIVRYRTRLNLSFKYEKE
jgi:flavin-binding protein dodecin